jgi:hypothetical protein
MTLDRRWYQLGRYRIFAMPLHLNPAWTTHHIFLGNQLIGRQLSVPCVADCDWYAAGAVYAASSYQGPRGYNKTPRRGPGRPRKEEVLRRKLYEDMAV